MNKLIWRCKFVISFVNIFRRPKGAFNISYKTYAQGWKLSGKLYDECGHIKASRVALDEITKWYCD